MSFPGTFAPTLFAPPDTGPLAFELEITTLAINKVFTIQGTGMSIDIEWGDGDTESSTANSTPHTYLVADTYILKITGSCNNINFLLAANWELLTDVLTPIQGLTVSSSLKDLFYGCDQIASIPSGLFDNCPNVTTFEDAFRRTAFTDVPSGLFDNNTLVTKFTGVFREAGITAIPSGLFDNNTAVTNFDIAFFSCTGLTSLPAGLFDNNSLMVNISNAFRSTSVTVSNASTWDIGEVTNMISTFFDTTLTTVDYDALLIGWEGQPHQSGVTFGAGNAQYTLGGAAETARDTLTGVDTWSIVDGGGV